MVVRNQTFEEKCETNSDNVSGLEEMDAFIIFKAIS